MKNVFKKCVICKRFHSRHFEALATPPPAERYTESKHFEVTVVDFVGPLFVLQRYTQRDEREDQKAYIRAIHFEIVEDLTNHLFLLAIKKFFALRGKKPQ